MSTSAPADADHGWRDTILAGLANGSIPLAVGTHSLVQEAVAFMDGVEAAFSDLESELLKRDPEAVARIEATFAGLRTDVDNAQQGRAVAPQEELDAAQSRLSFHLKVLKDAGLVSDRREGRWSYYTIVPEALAEVHDLAVGLQPKKGTLRVLQAGSCCR